MKARNCCKTMEAELTAWKANVYDIARKMESITGDERDKILPTRKKSCSTSRWLPFA